MKLGPSTAELYFQFMALLIFFWPLATLQRLGADALAVVVGALYGALVRRHLVAAQVAASG